MIDNDALRGHSFFFQHAPFVFLIGIHHDARQIDMQRADDNHGAVLMHEHMEPLIYEGIVHMMTLVGFRRMWVVYVSEWKCRLGDIYDVVGKNGSMLSLFCPVVITGKLLDDF
jgi:hypothetical protein